MNAQELVTATEAAIKAVFPRSEVKVKLGNSLGGKDMQTITIWFALGAPGTHVNSIWHNDPVSQIIHIWGIKSNEVLPIVTADSKARLTVNSKDPYMAFSSVKLPWRNFKGKADDLVRHIGRYFEKVKEVVKANWDEIPPSFKKEGIMESKRSKADMIEDRVHNEQYKIIKTEYGEKAAKSANYGWGTDEISGSITTKVYETKDGTMVLETTWDPSGPVDQQLDHDWSEYVENESIKSFKSFCNEQYKIIKTITNVVTN